MADASATRLHHGATADVDVLPSATLPTHAPEAPDPIAITRTIQSAVLRLRWTLLAMKLAADHALENPQQEPLFWPDLMDALLLLTPDADALDVVVDELRRA